LIKMFIKLIIISIIIHQTIQRLVFIQSLFRHGARYPMSKYYDWEEQQMFHGQLSPVGYRQHYNLGKQLRKEYIIDQQFLSPNYNYQEIQVRSTDVDRTISSAQSQLIGLYPQGFSIPQNLNPDYKRPPYQGAQDDQQNLQEFSLPHNLSAIPIHVRDEMDDLELQPWNRCDEYVNLVKKFKDQNIQLAQEFNKNFTQLYQKLTSILNQEINNYSQLGGVWGGVYDVFIANLYNARRIPDQLTREELENIKFVDSFSWFFGDFGTELGTKLLVTPFLKHLVDNFENKINGKYSNLKMMMFSAHDSNLSMNMRAFNFSSYQCLLQQKFGGNRQSINCELRPEFASSILWELHQDDVSQDKYFIKIKYDGKYMNLCEKENIQCDYQELKNRIMNYISKDYDGECLNKKSQKVEKLQSFQITNDDKKTEYIIIGVQSFVIFGLLLSIAFVILRYKQKIKQNVQSQVDIGFIQNS
ncbi:hypothetical protein IMG5_150410, partial [Ichthyophthirius multifiliis]